MKLQTSFSSSATPVVGYKADNSDTTSLLAYLIRRTYEFAVPQAPPELVWCLFCKRRNSYKLFHNGAKRPSCMRDHAYTRA